MAENKAQSHDYPHHHGAVALLSEAQNLADAFAQSALYREYARCKELLRRDPSLWERVQEYRQAQNAFERTRQQAGGGAGCFAEERHISHLYARLMLNPTTRGFLVCEQALLDTYRRVFDMLHAACDMD